MGEFRVGGRLVQGCRDGVTGAQTTSKSRRWEDTAKELSQDTEENNYVKTLEKCIVLHSLWESAFW